MDTIMEIANRHGLYVIEDAAQAYLSGYKGKPAGTMGHLATFSFHETKNVSCGEGGALLVNQKDLIGKAEILRDKGTNRKDFVAGKVKKYTWSGLGISANIGELAAAYLFAQLEEAKKITADRDAIWKTYHRTFSALPRNSQISVPDIPENVIHNSHIYHVLFSSEEQRNKAIAQLENDGINTATHYEPLHLSPEGTLFPPRNKLDLSSSLPCKLLRLPIWPGLPDGIPEKISNIIQAI